ncbi:MAG TPA: hypothetical protein VIA18_03450, partial [Polyangia bacterium]|nr:hypothetical protein [Polyangia bacterium]
MGRRWACALLLAATLSGCGDGRAWREADAAWRQRDARAWPLWRALDDGNPRGRAAHERLRAADRDYRRGIAALAAGDTNGARAALAAAVAQAPMDPALYLPLARACRDRGLDERAATLYRSFLAQAATGPDADAARAELAALG